MNEWRNSWIEEGLEELKKKLDGQVYRMMCGEMDG